MAISVDPLTDVIYIPKADLTLIQASPEVRELDVNAFHLWLLDWEDEEEAIPRPKTHNHLTETTLAGLTYARIIEILSPYTVEFEDGQYTVNCTGANHNISDKKVANQVSLIINNAAGLITNAQIEYSSFQNGVTVDVTSSYSGTIFPVGTAQRPVNNITDAHTIATTRGFTTFYIMGDLSLSAATPVMSGFTFIGQGMDRTTLSIADAANVDDCTYREAHVTGILDGDSRLVECLVDNLVYVKGYVEQCVLAPGTIELAGTEEAHFLDCWSGVPGTSTPVIDMGGSGQALALRNYNGGIKLQNKTGTDYVSIDLNSGQVKLAATVTAGDIVLRGVGQLTEDLSNGATIINQLVNREDIVNDVWDEVLTGASHNVPTSAGRRLRALSSTVITEGLTQASTVNTLTLNGDALTTDGAYDPAMIAIVEGTGAGQCRNIYEYNGTTRTAVVDRNWKTQPDGTSYYIIYADAGREHVNEGLAQGGTTQTIVLNALASSADDAYKGQTVFIRSGTGEDQSRLIVAYDGTTKVATLETGCPWDTVPDSTSAYVIIPTHVHTLPSISEEVWAYER